MSTPYNHHAPAHSVEERMGLLARDLLDDGAEQLPANVIARLNQARSLALSHIPQQKEWATEAVWATSGYGTSKEAPNWASKMWSALGVAPIVALALGLFAIASWQQDERIKDIATVDSALLTDVIPPEAYKDDGYVRFLMTNGKDLAVEEDDEEEKI